MNYHFDFASVLAYWPVILKGVGITIELIAFGAVFGVLLGTLCAWVRTFGPKVLRPFAKAYIELIRNTPFLIQLFFVFFGLPSLGIHLSEMQAAIFAMVINLGAYSAEIIRAGIEVTPKGQLEAASSLAMTRMQIFLYVVLLPAMRRIWPALSSQIVIVMLGSAVVSQIAAEDLSYAANFIQSRNFRAFESYIVSTAIYLVLAILLRQLLRAVGWWMFPRRSTR